MSHRFFIYTLTTSIVVLCLASMPAAAQTGASTPAATQATKPAQSPPTPRAADGKLDLSGLWVPAGPSFGLILRKDADGRPSKILFPAPDADFSKGDAAARARRAADPNQPPYKPELLAKVKYLDENTNKFDGVLHCLPGGVPRVGPPQQIVQTPSQVVFLYDLAREVSVQSGNYYRVIPTDGRPHRTDLDPSYMGDSVGHWEGDTLVVDVVDFNDSTWFASDGRFHSTAMHVTERFSREGDLLKYEVTVEDPNVLTKPWTMNPRFLKLDPSAVLTEDPPCVEKDASHLVNNEHH
jgi:hypothetical protein